MTRTIIYLHGFASSPQSKKAGIFRAPLEARGVNYLVPDLNVPDFEHLTLTAILQRIDETVQSTAERNGEIDLIGSSLGGLTALHYCDRYQNDSAAHVKRIVMLAPGLDFFTNREKQMGSGWEERWRTAGSQPFYNYQYHEERLVHFGLVDDLRQYNSFAVHVPQPILIYHGIHDTTVDYQQSVKFA
ncbi:MAG TPA: YqiA/YcfP family alpha/beta fold hydrolase, partial [Phototrophicaceae bacterium]|nr:YqiA/YcfP family alpha/beta fold hydrolase [Phototrophicaceae bacterium]